MGSARMSAEDSRSLMISPVKKLSALRLVSPCDTDQDMDMEVASVWADGRASRISYHSWYIYMHGCKFSGICLKFSFLLQISPCFTIKLCRKLLKNTVFRFYQFFNLHPCIYYINMILQALEETKMDAALNYIKNKGRFFLHVLDINKWLYYGFIFCDNYVVVIY